MPNKHIIYKENSFIIGDKEYLVEDLQKEYCAQKNRIKDIATSLGIKERTLQSIFSRYHLKKVGLIQDSFTENSCIINGQTYTKDWFYQQYIIEQKTKEELIKQLNINKDLFWEILKHFEINKNTEHKVTFFEDKFKINGREITLTDFVNYYVNQNHNIKETQHYFNISKKIFLQVVKYYNIKKTTGQTEQTKRITIQKKYGCDYLLQNPEIKAKKDKKCLEKWGNINPIASKKFREDKIKERGYVTKNQEHIEHKDIWLSDEKFLDYLKEKRKDAFEIAEYFNVDPSVIHARLAEKNIDHHLIKTLGGSSKYEEEIYLLLQQEYNIPQEDIERHVRHGIFLDKDDRREIDIYLPKYKMGIEFNGDYWHSDLIDKFQDHNGRSRTHQNKSLDALKNGIFIFHIFEYEWDNPIKKENIKNRLRVLLNQNKIIIGARKCKIAIVDKETKKDFFNINHIQGDDHSTFAIGLYYNDELVSCMSFVKPKTKYTWELSRFCSKHEYNIQGGASKLFKYFVEKYMLSGDQVVSYNDITKTKGDLYEILKFKCTHINPPNYIWMNFSTGDIRTRYQEQKGGEVERMHNKGYHRICDCGTKTWVYTKD